MFHEPSNNPLSRRPRAKSIKISFLLNWKAIMKVKTHVRFILTPLFIGAILLPQSAHAGWILDWIKCSEDCGWVCGCDGGELIRLQYPEQKKAVGELLGVMESFKSNVKSLSPEAKKLLQSLDRKGGINRQP